VIAVVSLVYFPLNETIYKKEERDIATATTNIAFYPADLEHVFPTAVCCPGCNWSDCPEHGVYMRKGFHSTFTQWNAGAGVVHRV